MIPAFTLTPQFNRYSTAKSISFSRILGFIYVVGHLFASWFCLMQPVLKVFIMIASLFVHCACCLIVYLSVYEQFYLTKKTLNLHIVNWVPTIIETNVKLISGPTKTRKRYMEYKLRSSTIKSLNSPHLAQTLSNICAFSHSRLLKMALPP